MSVCQDTMKLMANAYVSRGFAVHKEVGRYDYAFAGVMNAAPPPIMQFLSESAANNTYNYTLTALIVDEVLNLIKLNIFFIFKHSEKFGYSSLMSMQLTPDILHKFRTVTAQAVNRYCDQTVCTVSEKRLVHGFGLQMETGTLIFFMCTVSQVFRSCPKMLPY